MAKKPKGKGRRLPDSRLEEKNRYAVARDLRTIYAAPQAAEPALSAFEEAWHEHDRGDSGPVAEGHPQALLSARYGDP